MIHTTYSYHFNKMSCNYLFIISLFLIILGCAHQSGHTSLTTQNNPGAVDTIPEQKAGPLEQDSQLNQAHASLFISTISQMDNNDDFFIRLYYKDSYTEAVEKEIQASDGTILFDDGEERWTMINDFVIADMKACSLGHR